MDWSWTRTSRRACLLCSTIIYCRVWKRPRLVLLTHASPSIVLASSTPSSGKHQTCHHTPLTSSSPHCTRPPLLVVTWSTCRYVHSMYQTNTSQHLQVMTDTFFTGGGRCGGEQAGGSLWHQDTCQLFSRALHGTFHSLYQFDSPYPILSPQKPTC